MNASIDDLLTTLAEFRGSFAEDLDRVAATGAARADRAAAQDGLQLIWSFAVSGAGDSDLDDTTLSMLRAAFPDELFGAEPQQRFDELTDSVPNSYADQWKYMPSEFQCTLVRGCVNTASVDPVLAYRAHAVRLATATVDHLLKVNARSVYDIAKFDSMLKHLRVLTEVAIDESTAPDNDQIRAFCMGTDPARSLSFSFLVRTEPELASQMVTVFAEQYGADTTADLIDMAMVENPNDEDSAKLAALKALLS